MSSGANPPLPPRSNRRGVTKQERRSPLQSMKKFFLTILLLVGLAIIVYAVYTYMNAEKMLDEIDGGTDVIVPKEELAKEKPISILLLGLDSRPATGTLNTDVIMVATFNPSDQSATIVSIPRDTYLKAEGYKGRKANAMYSVVYHHDKEQAFPAIKSIFSEFIGIPIDYATIVDFNTFKEIVDELGGITVDVDQDMRYVDPTDGTNIDLKKGEQVLTGKEALDFVRYRYSNTGETPESSDFARNQRQQAVLAAMLNRLKSFDTLWKLNGILDAMGQNIRTDIPNQQLKSFIKTYATISNERIRYISIEGTWRSPYVYLNEEQFAEAKMNLKQHLELGNK